MLCVAVLCWELFSRSELAKIAQSVLVRVGAGQSKMAAFLSQDLGV